MKKNFLFSPNLSQLREIKEMSKIKRKCFVVAPTISYQDVVGFLNNKK